MRISRLWLPPLLLGCSLLIAVAAPPAWWSQRGATNSQPADDYAAANLGQLKHMATKAAAELNGFLPGGAGNGINHLIRTWDPANPNNNRDDFAVLNQGQLKYVAGIFYDRLAQVSYNGQPLAVGQTYPWTLGTSDDDAYSITNLGQLKYVFSFNPIPVLDTDSDGLLDSWEIIHFTTVNAQNGAGSYTDGDSLTNREEFLLGTNPKIQAVPPSSTLPLIVYCP